MSERRKVLIVDDERDFVKAAKRILEANSFDTVMATSKIEGLEKVRQEHPDVVVVGTISPRGDAFALHREIMENPTYNDVSMVVIDACPDEINKKGWTRAEGIRLDPEADYLIKPVSQKVLLSSVEGLMKRAGYIPGSVLSLAAAGNK